MRQFDRDLWLLTVAMVLFALGAGLYQALLFVYAIDLGASRFTVGLLSSVVVAVAAISTLPGAWAARRFRLKPVIAGVWWLTVPAALCFFFAPNWQWLIPGLVITGLYAGNNPAIKTYIQLKSSPERRARHLTTIFGAVPLGLIVAPLFGGALASRLGMRPVFAIAAILLGASALTVSLMGDIPYNETKPLDLRFLRRNRGFSLSLAFFFVGFLATSTSQAFFLPYLKQVHLQGYTALGVYAALAALGTAALTKLLGHVTDLRGPHLGAAGVLIAMAMGSTLLLTGWNPPLWGAAVLFCGSFEAMRLVATGIVAGSFGELPSRGATPSSTRRWGCPWSAARCWAACSTA